MQVGKVKSARAASVNYKFGRKVSEESRDTLSKKKLIYVEQYEMARVCVCVCV